MIIAIQSYILVLLVDVVVAVEVVDVELVLVVVPIEKNVHSMNIYQNSSESKMFRSKI